MGVNGGLLNGHKQIGRLLDFRDLGQGFLSQPRYSSEIFTLHYLFAKRLKFNLTRKHLIMSLLQYKLECWHVDCYCSHLRGKRTKGIGNMKITKSLLAGLVAMIAAAGIVSSANATFINGTIGFTSAHNPTGGGGVTQLGGNTTVNFNNPLQVDFGNGDFTGLEGNNVTFTDFTFDGSGALVGGPIVPLWTFTTGTATYSFDLLHLASATFMQASGNNALAVSGEGIIHITGFQDTVATFSIQASGGGFTFDILRASNTANGQAVPDAGSAVSLLGLGLLGLEVLRRKLIA
jgi:hypothetical protein